MTSDTLQKARQAEPFKPFIIHMADGREIAVTQPELIASKAGTRTAVVMDGDSFEMIDLLLATGLESRNVAEMPTVGGNVGDRPQAE